MSALICNKCFAPTVLKRASKWTNSIFSIACRIDSVTAAECGDEVWKAAESRGKTDFGHRKGSVMQQHRSMFQANFHQILIRAVRRKLFENAAKMKHARM